MSIAKDNIFGPFPALNPQPVTGPLTDAQLRASSVPVVENTLPNAATFLGSYRMSETSGPITGVAVIAGGIVFAARWGDAAKIALITRVRARYTLLTIFTAAQELGLGLRMARAFTASDTGGTGLSVAGNNAKMRTAFPSSVFTDIRLAAATVLGAGTRTLDADFVERVSGWSQDINAAAGVQQQVGKHVEVLYDADLYNRREHPITLAQNEGIEIQNSVAFASASGVVRLDVEMCWNEYSTYPF